MNSLPEPPPEQDRAVLDLVKSSLLVVAGVIDRDVADRPGRHRAELARAVGLITEGLAALVQCYQRSVAHERAAGDSTPVPQRTRSRSPR